ncbi:SOS response-associated peptidase family protein [Achromobacter xylosoxidans]
MEALADGPKPPKQPYYVHATDNAPLFFAALSNWRPEADKDEAHGFALVTNDSLGGMIDVHDRRPVALPPDLAIHWMDPKFPPRRRLRCWSMACRKRPSPGTQCAKRSETQNTNCPTPSSRCRLCRRLYLLIERDRGG